MRSPSISPQEAGLGSQVPLMHGTTSAQVGGKESSLLFRTELLKAKMSLGTTHHSPTMSYTAKLAIRSGLPLHRAGREKGSPGKKRGAMTYTECQCTANIF